MLLLHNIPYGLSVHVVPLPQAPLHCELWKQFPAEGDGLGGGGLGGGGGPGGGAGGGGGQAGRNEGHHQGSCPTELHTGLAHMDVLSSFLRR